MAAKLLKSMPTPGADPSFQVRGGGALKIIAPSGGRRENVGGISCEKSRFYAKKSYFSQCRAGKISCYGSTDNLTFTRVSQDI